MNLSFDIVMKLYCLLDIQKFSPSLTSLLIMRQMGANPMTRSRVDSWDRNTNIEIYNTIEDQMNQYTNPGFSSGSLSSIVMASCFVMVTL